MVAVAGLLGRHHARAILLPAVSDATPTSTCRRAMLLVACRSISDLAAAEKRAASSAACAKTYEVRRFDRRAAHR